MNFNDSIIAACSTVADGPMKRTNAPDPIAIDKNRRQFLNKHGITPEQTTLVYLVYEGDDYARYRIVDERDRGHGITTDPTTVSDALATNTPGVALFLLIADCIAAILYDPTTKSLMLSHLGRHNLEQDGGKKSIEYMVQSFGGDPKTIQVWLSPAAGKENYPLYSFNNRSMHEVACEQMTTAGVPMENISVSDADTTADRTYYSHSEFLKGNRPTDGRFAVVAMLPEASR